MADKLVIVESPSKAKTIEKYLGKDYTVIASGGHIIDLPKSKFGIDVENNFKPEFKTMVGKTKTISEIKKLSKDKSKIFLATDPDREGEAIAFHLKNVLKLKDNDKCRIKFNEITKNAVNDAIKKPEKVDFNLVDAQITRRVLDRIVGYKLSPLLWKKIKKGLSAGRVQSVALKIIMDRERLIRNFIPKEYWDLSVILENNIGEKLTAKYFSSTKKKEELNTLDDVLKIVKDIDKKDYLVEDIKKSEKKKNPYPPFTTSTMQQDSSNKLSFTVKKTMSVAQKLYENGYITYMRTDSVRISDDALNMSKEYIINNFSSKYYERRVFKSKSNSQDAHEAIRPTDLTKDISKLTSDEEKLFNLIKNRFLASQMSNAVYDVTKITIKVDKYTFISNGSVIKFDGYLKLYKNFDDEKDNILPTVNVNDILKQLEIKYEQKFTAPLSRYTEASLVKTLEEKGIGRPSTYAPTISTILDRLYIEKENKFLKPTDLGEGVNELLENNFQDIVDENFTKNMEDTLDDIEAGTKTYIETITNFYNPFIKNLEEKEQGIERIKIKEEVSDTICELCGKNMVVKIGRYGKFLACPGFPDCKNIKSIVQKIDIPCPKCGGEIIIKKTKTKRMFYVCSNNDNTENSKCDYISWNKPKKGD
ncbi:MAG: type I DNA topoisomerase [Clostridia bacterium]